MALTLIWAVLHLRASQHLRFPVLSCVEHCGPVLHCFTTYSSYLHYELWGLCPLPMLPVLGMFFMTPRALPTSPLLVFYCFMKHMYQRDTPKKIN